ncbi:alpha/beta hydrolase [Pseudonocardia charpentierae]|uniref:Alpha/beta hydrolase n=1 Tax=Pseudonocardia charpentierae TaxID=3075545 RepID=A0ABU2N790_9PSEU|nr:alpha/beta hydrolase [Pseudonocardia sp. DSM 45834]MDT0349806.1 alpha/beta hydrolase [Pseudonocardia sp. DSM 45834]
MTAAALGQVRRWSAAGLDAVAVRLEATGRALATICEALERARPPDAWRGAAADAARAGHERVATLLRMLATDVVSVQAGARAASDAVGGIQAALAQAHDLADANGFTIAADGTVADTALSGPGTADTRPAVQAEIVDRVEQVLRASAVLDADLAALLMAVAQSGADPAASTGSSAAAIGVVAPPDGTPADSAGWWSALSPAAQRTVVAEHPEWVGNRDGLPSAVRDEANRALLGAQVARLDADLRSVRARYDALTAAGPASLEAVWLTERNNLLGRLGELHRRRQVLDAVRATISGSDRRLLLLDLDLARPRAAVAVGDVDAAEHVAVLTPGFGNTVRGDLTGVADQADALRARSLAALDGAGRHGESVAAVAWLGYDVPVGLLGVGTPDAARAGGADLARFYEGVDASRRTDPHLTALGHSYGSLTTGYALQQAVGVDDAVLFGSPGIGIDHVDALHVPADHTGVVEASWDPVADLGWFGDDPNRLEGVTGLSARAATLPDGTASAGSVLHAQYLTPGSTSQYNIAATVAGLAEQRILDHGLGVGDVVRGALDGRSGS